MNKKFLAGATLAAFATTLVPAAAFADVKLSKSGAFEGSDTIANVTYNDKSNNNTPVVDYADVYVDLKDDNGLALSTTGPVYVWAEVDGKVTDGVNFHSKSGSNYSQIGTGKFIDITTLVNDGTEQVFISSTEDFGGKDVVIKAGLEINANPATTADIDVFNFTTAVKFRAVSQGEQYSLALAGGAPGNVIRTATGNNVGKYDYELTTTVGTTGLAADVITMNVTSADAPTGTPVEITVNKDGLAATSDNYEINSRDVSTVKLVADKAGDYTVYVKVGETEKTVKVTATAGAATAKLASTEEKVVATKNATNVVVNLFDTNGDMLSTVTAADAANFEAEILNAPEDSALEGHVAALTATTPNNNEKAKFTFTPDQEGEYTIKVRNATTGKGFTTTVEAAKMGDVVKMELDYESTTVALGAAVGTPDVIKYDADGVSVKSTSNVVFSANGKGFAGFTGNPVTGAFNVSNDDKYAGETITVSAIDTKNAVTATTEFKIAGEAQGIELINTEAQAGKDAKLSFSVVDENGSKIVLAGTPGTATVVVLEKPEGAKVVASIDATADLAVTGVETLDFIANEEGTYKLQVMIPVVKTVNNVTTTEYHTGVVEVTVGEKEVAASGVVTMFINSANYMINGESAAMDVAPFVQEGRTFLPVRTVAEAVGAEVAYDEATQVATFTKGKDVVTLTLGSNIMTVNGEAVTMDAAAFSKDGRTVAPLRFVAEAFGCDVEAITAVDGTTSGVILTLK